MKLDKKEFSKIPIFPLKEYEEYKEKRVLELKGKIK
jgi:hypothetical protein